MHGNLHGELGWKGWVMSLILEGLFLTICIVLINFGVSELKKRKAPAKNTALVALGFVLAAISLFATKLLIQG
jgi:hypothetical protein